MSFNGSLTIKLQCQDLLSTQLGIELSRPALAEKLLLNQSPTVAPKRLGQLLSVCRQAQSLAACLATSEVAQADNLISQHRDALLIENIGQSLWRLSLELPQIIAPKRSNETASLLHAYKMLQKHSMLLAQKTDLSPDDITVFANNAQALFSLLTKVESHTFINMNFTDINYWLNSDSLVARMARHLPYSGLTTKELVAQLLPAKPEPAICQQLMELMLSQPSFCAQPTMTTANNDKAQFTGPLSMVSEHSLIQEFINTEHCPLVVALVAKLIYCANCIKQLLTIGTSSDDVIAGVFQLQESQFSWVQSARGLLLHACRTQNNQIKQYQVCAPTEWNFHPNGLFADFLTKAEFKSNSDIEKQARLAVLTVDPCIDFTLGVSHA